MISSPRPPRDDASSHTDTAYLEQLTFDPALRRSFFNIFVTRTRLILLFIIILCAWGVFAYRSLPRESNPEVKIPVVIVTTALPGGSVTDIEELITKKIEPRVAAINGVDEVRSTSANSVSVISITFISGQDITEALRSVRDEVDRVIPDLPDDAQTPDVVNVSFDDQPVLTMALTSPLDDIALRDQAHEIEDDLEKIPGVRDARLSGGGVREFSVRYDPVKLAQFGITVTEANAVVRAASFTVPAGNFDRDQVVVPVRVDGRFTDAQSLGALPIRVSAQGGSVLLRDVATVEESAAKRVTFSRLAVDGGLSTDAVVIDVVKRPGASIVETVDEAKETIERAAAALPAGTATVALIDQSDVVARDFEQLRHDFFITITLVMALLVLIVGVKEAIVAGLAIPLTFFFTFGMMQLSGISLNFLSVFSLLLALGLLVDDAIVVVSATKQYMRTGKFTPEEAVLLVLRDFRVVLLTTTLATTWAFLPLLMSTGIIGEFIKSIPITVSVTLIGSLLIALFINHPLAAALERIRLTRPLLTALSLLVIVGGFMLAASSGVSPLFAGVGVMSAGLAGVVLWDAWRGSLARRLMQNEEETAREARDDDRIRERLRHEYADRTSWRSRLMHGIVTFDAIIPVYKRFLTAILASTKRRWAAIGGITLLFGIAVALPVIGIVKTEFFPATDEDLVFIDVSAPPGTTLDATNRIVMQVEEKLRAYPDIIAVSSVVGRPGIQPNNAEGGAASGETPHRAGLIAKLVQTEDRSMPSYDLATAIDQDLNTINGADVTATSQQGGPPTGADIDVRIEGDDLAVLERIAQQFQGILKAMPSVSTTDLSLKSASVEYTFVLDQTRLGLYGLDSGDVGAFLRTAVAGTEISTVIRNEREIDVVAQTGEREIPTLAQLQNLAIPTRDGRLVSLSSVATVTLTPSLESITRIDQRRFVSVTAGVTPPTPPQEVLADFQERIAQIELPSGYTVAYGGENEENQESVQSILRAMLIAAALIISTMVIQFNSFRQAMIVLVTLPLALIGVSFGLALFGIPLSFPGLIGILALFGIVVKNAIILIDKINLNRESGIAPLPAIVDAGASRFESIIITSLATIAGIIPITLSNDLWRALGSAIIFGLIFSSILTLFIVPALYAVLMGVKKEQKE